MAVGTSAGRCLLPWNVFELSTFVEPLSEEIQDARFGFCRQAVTAVMATRLKTFQRSERRSHERNDAHRQTNSPEWAPATCSQPNRRVVLFSLCKHGCGLLGNRTGFDKTTAEKNQLSGWLRSGGSPDTNKRWQRQIDRNAAQITGKWIACDLRCPSGDHKLLLHFSRLV